MGAFGEPYQFARKGRSPPDIMEELRMVARFPGGTAWQALNGIRNALERKWFGL